MRGERAGAVVEAALQRCTLVVIGDVGGRVALVVGKVRAHEDGDVLAEAGVDTARRQLVADGGDEGRDTGLIVVLVLVEVVAGIDPDALEVGVENEVHHARDRVRPVHRGSAARQHVHPLDERGGNLVDVRIVTSADRGARTQAQTVH